MNSVSQMVVENLVQRQGRSDLCDLCAKLGEFAHFSVISLFYLFIYFSIKSDGGVWTGGGAAVSASLWVHFPARSVDKILKLLSLPLVALQQVVQQQLFY